jgi:hypothetical protein
LKNEAELVARHVFNFQFSIFNSNLNFPPSGSVTAYTSPLYQPCSFRAVTVDCPRLAIASG